MIIFLIAWVLLIILGILSVKIVPQSKVYVLERLGSYQTTWSTGVHFKLPIFDMIRSRVSLKERVVDFPPQPVITKDNVTMQIDTVVFYQVTDAKLYTYGVDNPLLAIENLTATTLRNIIGDLELDHTLTSRDVINTKITSILDSASDKWGIKVNRVELKNIVPPAEIQNAMEKQMKAERERRQLVLQAEGRKNADILVAEGEKRSQVLRAEAEKESLILHAEAVREQSIKEAEGKAKAIEIVQTATARGLEMIKAVDVSKSVISLKSLETFEKVADGKATKIIIPSEIQSMAGLLASAKEIVNGSESNSDESKAEVKHDNKEK